MKKKMNKKEIKYLWKRGFFILSLSVIWLIPLFFDTSIININVKFGMITLFTFFNFFGVAVTGINLKYRESLTLYYYTNSKDDLHNGILFIILCVILPLIITLIVL